MLSIPDMAILGAAALIFFGPEQLPKVMRKAGMFMRDVQNTSQAFVREMERAADEHSPDDVARAHLIDGVPNAHEPWSAYGAGETAAYGAYDGGAVASHETADIPIDEHPGPVTPEPDPSPQLPFGPVEAAEVPPAPSPHQPPP